MGSTSLRPDRILVVGDPRSDAWTTKLSPSTSAASVSDGAYRAPEQLVGEHLMGALVVVEGQVAADALSARVERYAKNPCRGGKPVRGRRIASCGRTTRFSATRLARHVLEHLGDEDEDRSIRRRRASVRPRAGTPTTLSAGLVPPFAPPLVPVGPVVGGTGTMLPGGLIGVWPTT